VPWESLSCLSGLGSFNGILQPGIQSSSTSYNTMYNVLHECFCISAVEFSPGEANFLCHSDGGTRGDSCSAIGWIIEAYVVKEDMRHIFPVAMSGKFFDSPISSFTAEAIALDEASGYLINFISKLFDNSSVSNRRK